MGKIKRSSIVIFVIIFGAIYSIFNLGHWKQKYGVIEWDIISYYAYLPAAVIYHDLTLGFKDEKKDEQFVIIWGEKGKPIKTSMGLAMLYAPFFLVGHLAALVLEYDAGGYSEPYKLALLFSCIFFLWVGIYYVRKLVSLYFSDLIASVTIVCIVFGTGLFYYSTRFAPMPHTYNFALIAMFVYHTRLWYIDQNIKQSIIIGLLAGIIALVRPTNILVGIFFVLWGIQSSTDWKERFLLFTKKWRHLLLIVFMALIVWLPQMAYWKLLTGKLFYFSYGDEGFYFVSWNFLRGMFSYRNGWLLYSPIMILALAGIWTQRKNLREAFFPTLFFTPIFVYVVLSWWCWWYTGFGNRAMIDISGVLFLPLASFIHWSLQQKRKVKVALVTVTALLFLRGAYNSVQFHYNGIHYNSMTKKSFMASFFSFRGTETYYQNLREPDYVEAVKGIQAFADERNRGMDILLNMEEKERLAIANTSVKISHDIDRLLSSYFSRSSEKSLCLTSKTKQVQVVQHKAYNNETYEISVWRKTGSGKGSLILEYHTKHNPLVVETSKPVKHADGWDLLKIEFTVPFSYYEIFLTVTLTNSEDEATYFDDLRFKRIGPE